MAVWWLSQNASWPYHHCILGFLLWERNDEWRKTKDGKQFNSKIEPKHNVSQTPNLGSKRHICPSENNRNLSVPLLRKSEVMFRQRNLYSSFIAWIRISQAI